MACEFLPTHSKGIFFYMCNKETEVKIKEYIDNLEKAYKDWWNSLPEQEKKKLLAEENKDK